MEPFWQALPQHKTEKRSRISISKNWQNPLFFKYLNIYSSVFLSCFITKVQHCILICPSSAPVPQPKTSIWPWPQGIPSARVFTATSRLCAWMKLDRATRALNRKHWLTFRWDRCAWQIKPAIYTSNTNIPALLQNLVSCLVAHCLQSSVWTLKNNGA